MGNICHKKQLNEVDKMLILSGCSSRPGTILNNKLSISNSDTKSNSYNNDNNLNNNLKLDDFKILNRLGKGSFGKVYLVESKINKKLYAMKILNKDKIKDHDLIENSKVERILLSILSFPFIVELYCSFQTSKRLFLVTEYVQGGDLFKLMIKTKKFTEKQIKLYLAEILLCLKFLHENNCIYRDLKPENILLATDGHLKLVDFGLTKMFLDKGRRYLKKEINSSLENSENSYNKNRKSSSKSNYCFNNVKDYSNNSNKHISKNYYNLSPQIQYNEHNINLNSSNNFSKIDLSLSKNKSSYNYNSRRADSICGTAEYMAPEIITGNNYDARVDWFSFGAIAFFFYTGYAVFNCRSQPLDVSLKQKPIYYNPKIFDETTQDFINQLLNFYPEYRLGTNGVEEIMNHKYFKDINFKKVLNKEYCPDYIPDISNKCIIDESSFIKDDDFIRNTFIDDNNNISNNNNKAQQTYEGFTYMKDNNYIIVPESYVEKQNI